MKMSKMVKLYVTFDFRGNMMFYDSYPVYKDLLDDCKNYTYMYLVFDIGYLAL